MKVAEKLIETRAVLDNKTITGDALHAQKPTASALVEKGVMISSRSKAIAKSSTKTRNEPMQIPPPFLRRPKPDTGDSNAERSP